MLSIYGAYMYNNVIVFIFVSMYMWFHLKQMPSERYLINGILARLPVYDTLPHVHVQVHIHIVTY